MSNREPNAYARAMRADDPRRAKCPACGTRPATQHATTSQTRIWYDLECISCGARWRADRASGRLIARLDAHQ